MLTFFLFQSMGSTVPSCFHGADVRRNFLSHIVKEFKSKGINLFIDNDIERSKSIGPELIEAIVGSRIGIVLLSKNYASSTWCLNELVEIIKCRKAFGQTVMVLFYEVDPTHVKKQTGDFGKVFRKTCRGKEKEEIRRWKHALTEVAQIADIKNFSHLGIAKDRLKDKKVLVVLDDVDRLVQLEAMAKEISWFGPGSRIIITTQDQNVLKASGIDHIHRVSLPSYDEALQMFCMYAFDQKYPKDGFKELAWRVRDLVGRLPLGLKVMGSYFRGMSEQDWTEALPRLKAHLDRNGEIASILKFSYDALNDEEKSLFLHIACFFNFHQVDIMEGCLAKTILDVRHGLRVLAEKSLISIDMGEIEMATLLVQLGRKIVREQSVNEPGKRQFLIDAIDIGEVLSNDKADSSSVIGIKLERDEEITWTSERAFERFFNPKFLVKLGMVDSKLKKLWEDTKPLTNLKWMDLSNSKSLKELPDLSTATNLYYLDLPHCSSLVKLPSSIGNAINLQSLHLSFCSNLVEIPSSIGNLTNLQELNLSYCSSLMELPSSIGSAINLQKLNLSGCSCLVELPSSIGNATNLQELNLGDCSSLVELPSSIGSLINLQELNLGGCSSLVKLPSSIGNAVNLQKLNLGGCSSLTELPPSVWTAINLKILSLSNCSSMVELPSSMRILVILRVAQTLKTQELDPWIGRICGLYYINLSGMKKLVSLPQLPDSLLELDASNCESLERLDCSFPSPDIRLNFAKSFKLNQEARDLIIQTPTNKYAVFPAEEVPMCFPYRSSGSSLTLNLNQMPLCKSNKYKYCIICADMDTIDFRFWGEAFVWCRITSAGNALSACYRSIQQLLPGHLYTFKVEFETGEMTSNELVFEFEIEFRIPRLENYKTWKIKECGMLQLMEVPSC
ncbi:hypothetical protein HID58_030111 [Brassica napus]|uniref:ADP-ribosyl cyclase/cyclic ADP-ribose hydrolase n=1 Tax=Brassica napus TaxID=3708 RepID=A0ABQ8CF24_BRANA|nr:hypothetical protein HID58_030111 [Brassica napus]